ncbi:hypothetical protein [Flavobacterium beibuense]|uniref:WG repeat-containing protein n=1 Tax=Flavobacterium beibuense TaxID=657326 RepID=A0A444WBG6_9FLAO|nr:hypothetical protein [Flavobacterium beibuense]RYJ43167.1 hypothetical protein NU09_1505 [Flavobacterium beibuense]
MKQILVVGLFLLNGLSYSQNLDKTIIRDDNDYVLYNDTNSPTESTPNEVVTEFEKVLKSIKYLKTTVLFKIKNNNDIDTYALVVNDGLNKEIFILPYNHLEKRVANNYIKINGKWGFNSENGFDFKLLDYPNIKTELIDNNLYIYLKERVHNGNSYNAVVTKVFEITKDLDLNLKFCYEEVCLTGDGIKIIRVLKEDNLFCYKNEDNKLRYIGSLVIDRENGKIESRQCDDNDLCEILFTCSGENEHSFIKSGYNFEY